MEYSHTQVGRLSHVLTLVALLILPLAWWLRGEPVAQIIVVAGAGATVLAGLMFHTLTVRDEGDRLALVFGPLPLFRVRLRYVDMTAVEPGRTSWIDGWGIHYVPGRGTTYNVWGFGCAVVRLGKRTVRVGSDDVEGLVAFLRTKIDAGSR